MAEQEREQQLIEQAAATLFPAYFSATLVSESAKELAREAAARLVNAGWRPPPSGDAVERASEYIERATAGLPVIKPLSGEYVSIPVPPPDELVERVARAIYGELGEPEFADLPSGFYELLTDAQREEYRDKARDAFRALRALGEA